MRGTLDQFIGGDPAWSVERIIPAHAGNSVVLIAQTPSPRKRTSTDIQRSNRIIPAHAGNSKPIVSMYGSSPRITLHPHELVELIVRIIPAHAGNSILAAYGPLAYGSIAGSSPRMRGTPRACPIVTSAAIVVVPDHPRACGELAPARPMRAHLRRIIPAHAGNSAYADRLTAPGVASRIIPAHAGNSRPPLHLAMDAATDHPRACGELSSTGDRADDSTDHPRACGELWNEFDLNAIIDIGSSPRMRGTREMGGRRSQDRGRIIPAHAGNSSMLGRNRHLPTDHPRACGELSCRF